MAFSLMTLGIITPSILILSIMALRNKDTEQNDT